MRKVFLVKDHVELSGDSRDVVVSCQYRKQVIKWCKKNNISVEFAIHENNRYIAEEYFEVDLWRIRDDQQRALFVLRWA